LIAWSRLHRIVVPSENKSLIALSFVVGLVTGVSAWAFIRLIEVVQFWPPVPGQTKFFGLTLNRLLIVALPAVGGLLCGLVVQYLAPSAKGTGTSDLMYALRRKGSHIPWRYTFFKTIASVFTVASGGAAGPEGPVVSIGAGVGSLLGEWRGGTQEYVRNLTVAGAAAGFAAVFNAPIAGVLFAIEVLLREFASHAFAMVILSTVTASVTTHLLLGNRVFVEVPMSYAFNHIAELGFYALLGILAAVVSKIFVQVYFFVEHQFDRWIRAPQAVKTMTGGLILGLLALAIPNVLGNGHVEIPRLIVDEQMTPWAWKLIVLLLFGKILACPLTVGSGGSGGIFIPYLLMGALLGGIVGRLAHAVYPAAAPAGAYMLVGMGAVFSGITYAPFTGILLLFELTHDYNVILPLMFTVGVTLLVARSLDPESIDSRKLLNKGVRIHETPELRALENYRVEQVMTRDVKAIPAAMPLSEVSELIGQFPHTGYPVVDANGKVVGLLTYAELHQASDKPGRTPEDLSLRAGQLMRADFPSVFPGDSLTDALVRMRGHHVDRVLVVDPATRALSGMLTKGDILNIYEALLK